MTVEEIEVRCPVPYKLPDGHCLPGKLFLKLRISGELPSYVHPDNLIELACEDCAKLMRRQGRQVTRVLHRFDMAGTLIETLTDGEVI